MICFILILAFCPALMKCSSLDSEWINFKSSCSKEYATEEEESKRFDIWKSNLAIVENHNEEAAEGGHGYTMAINQFSDLTYEEFEKTMLGYVHSDKAAETFEYFQVKETPDAIDYRDDGLVTDVKNQGACGSCWAFSATGGIEGVWARQVGELISVSEQQLIDCGPGNCEGGNMGAGFGTAKGGIMKETDYPYEHVEKECRFDETLAVSSVTGFKAVAHDEEQLELALAEVGYPISIAVRASSTFQHYSSGIYDDVECVDDGGLNHAILLVGYHKTDPDKMYWIAKNSWGLNWGGDGYIKMKMGQNTCGVAKRPVYPVIEI